MTGRFCIRTSSRSARPELLRLADAIERLGRLAGDTGVPAPEPTEPVPNWLAGRLVHTVGLTREEVAALNLEQAVDRWAEFAAAPRQG